MSSYKHEVMKGTVADVEGAFSDIEELQNEVQEIVDNASEGLSQTRRIQTLSETADTLSGMTCPDVPESISGDAISYGYSTPKSKRQSPSRAVRRDNALAVLQAASEYATTKRDELAEKMENGADGDAKQATEDGGELPSLQEQHDELDNFVSELDDAISNAESCEFPGMFG